MKIVENINRNGKKYKIKNAKNGAKIKRNRKNSNGK